MTGGVDVRLRACLDCGKCVGACPIAALDGGLSPRRIIRKALKGDLAEAAEAAYRCLTCGRCDVLCPQNIPYTETVRDLRIALGPSGKPETASHCGVFGTLQRMQTTPDLKPRRLDWLGDGLKTDPESDTLLWVGCVPYFGAYFPDWSEDVIDVAKNAVRLLNALGVEPAVSAKERCCGHDALWTGDLETFEKLGKLNLEWLAKSPATRIVTLCPSCALALRKEIPARVGPIDKEVTTLVEVLAEHHAELNLDEQAATVTYHDPCRQGRHGGVYDAPREVLDALPGVELEEMRHHREGSLCCGGGNWTSCDGTTRRLQSNRLEEAVATGAEAMVTSCPRCLIHLRCAREGHDAKKEHVGLPTVDLGGLVADRLKEAD